MKKMFYFSPIFISLWLKNLCKCLHHSVSHQNTKLNLMGSLTIQTLPDMPSSQARLWLVDPGQFTDISGSTSIDPPVKLCIRPFQYMGRSTKSPLQYTKSSWRIRGWIDTSPGIDGARGSTAYLGAYFIGWTEKRWFISNWSRIILAMGMELSKCQ